VPGAYNFVLGRKFGFHLDRPSPFETYNTSV
jgi:hypothetical protein